MTVETGIVFGLLFVSLVLFAWERFSFDVTALIILSVLLISGIITPDEGLAGFSNRATVTIAAMFVLTEGLSRTGFLQVLGRWLGRVGRGEFWRTLVVLMAAVGVVSAFINNTAAVAIFIPVVIGVSARAGISPSKLLIPMSFASMFGGVTTLIGTSTNLLGAPSPRTRGWAASPCSTLPRWGPPSSPWASPTCSSWASASSPSAGLRRTSPVPTAWATSSPT